MLPRIKIKNDKYRKNRGGYSRIYAIFCSKCSHKLCLYQKDGPGIIKRLYVDRIIQIPFTSPSLTLSERLTCSSCFEILGISYIYEKENRVAYRIFVGAIYKALTKKK